MKTPTTDSATKYQKKSLIFLLSTIVIIILLYGIVMNVNPSNKPILSILIIITLLLIPCLSITSLTYAIKSIRTNNKKIKGYLLTFAAGFVFLISMLFPIAGIRTIINILGTVDQKDPGTITGEVPDKPSRSTYIMPVPRQMSDMANKEAAAYLDEVMQTNKNAVRTESGLIYEIMEPGDNRRPGSKEDTLIMTWEFLNRNGSRVANSDNSETSIMHREYQLKDMMPGMAEGVMFIGKGGRIKLYMPPHLVYDNEESFLREVIFLVEIKDIVHK